jgi:hypothetical protein
MDLRNADMVSLSEYCQAQMQEAFGPVNRWYCSQHYGYEINDPETLLAYYIKHGGASNFARCKGYQANRMLETCQAG